MTRSAASTLFLNKKSFKHGTSLKNLLSCAFICAVQSGRKVLHIVMDQI